MLKSSAARWSAAPHRTRDQHRAEVARILARDFSKLPRPPRTLGEICRKISWQTGRPVDVDLAALVQAALTVDAVRR